MIITILLSVAITFLNTFFAFFLPQVTQLPFGIDQAMTTGFGYWNSFMQDFWPVQVIWTDFLWIVSILLVLLIARIFRIIPS